MVPLPLLHGNVRTRNMRYSEIQERREDSWRFLRKEGACPLLGSLHVHDVRIQTTGMCGFLSSVRCCVLFRLHTPGIGRRLERGIYE